MFFFCLLTVGKHWISILQPLESSNANDLSFNSIFATVYQKISRVSLTRSFYAFAFISVSNLLTPPERNYMTILFVVSFFSFHLFLEMAVNIHMPERTDVC